ncbi:hypothetical protein J6590_061064 [Homalodisca vitripennis]|nr:hypothetical protein J6590_061064 [Homalodisca vitripennis]
MYGECYAEMFRMRYHEGVSNMMHLNTMIAVKISNAFSLCGTVTEGGGDKSQVGKALRLQGTS